jgi:hypothetical protein
VQEAFSPWTGIRYLGIILGLICPLKREGKAEVKPLAKRTTQFNKQIYRHDIKSDALFYCFKEIWICPVRY